MKDYGHLFDLFTQKLQASCSELQVRQPAELYAPAAYILNLGGKRLRPLLTLVACELYGSDPRTALDAAMSIELFHNFSLIHDDILDQAPLRRGHATVHEKWNGNIAILSGDVMLVKAMQCLEIYPPPLSNKLYSLFSRTAIEVCEGQQLDMNFEKAKQVAVEDYIEMIRLKTAVLLGCSLQMGAMIAGADQAEQSGLSTFGTDLGIAFQLRDDLLDAFPTNRDNFGKLLGGDIINNKKTFLLLSALEKSSSEQRKLLETLSDEKDRAVKVARTLALFEELGVKSACERAIDRYTSGAIKALDSLSVPEERKKSLRGFALQLMDRHS